MIGKRLLLFHELDSTNNYAAKLLSEGNLTHGTVILAEKQTAGRGQRGNTWLSTGLKQFTGSYYLETAFLSVEHLVFFNIAISLSVRSAVASFVNEKVEIKWPNDILVNSRKIAGILIETQFGNGRLTGAIVGVGVNLTAEITMETACCVEDFTDKFVEPITFLEALSEALELHFNLLRSGEFIHLKNLYYTHLWRYELPTKAELESGEIISGKVVGIDDTGNLLFESNGVVGSYGIQKIKFNYSETVEL